MRRIKNQFFIHLYIKKSGLPNLILNKKFIILTLLLLNFSILTESAKKNSQTNIKNSVDTKKIDEELELADDYYYGNKILKAKEIYEKYSPVSDEAKLKLAKYYIDDIQDEKSTVILEELARKKK